jgi:hypothetical protein
MWEMDPLLTVDEAVAENIFGTFQDIDVACRQATSILAVLIGPVTFTAIELAKLSSRVMEICLSASRGDVVREAESDANGFQLPAEVFTRDSQALHRSGSLSALIRSRHDQMQHSRFNVASCMEIFQGDPEFSTLLSLACAGAVIDVAPDFYPTPTSDPPRRLMQRLPHTLARHVFKLWLGHAVLVLPVQDLTDIPQLHINNLHWCPKPGAPEGRLLGDCSNREFGVALNSDCAKDLIESRYGSLYHPTIGDLIRMIFRVASSHPDGVASLLLWKEDISGAFGQYNHHVDAVPYLAFDIGDGLVMLYLVGMFGWTGSPFVFGVFSRALKRQCNLRMAGEVDVYVDDFMGVSPSDVALADQRHTREVITSALGPSAINVEKTMPPSRSAEFIGWLIDLDSQSLRPNDRGICKLVACFFGCQLSRPFSLHQFQVLASLACRYSQGLTGMRPFVQPLYAMTRGWPSSKVKKTPSSAAKLAIVIWRAACLILLAQPHRLAVPLASVVRDPDSWSHYIISDAGPLALGVAVYERLSNTCLGHASYTLPYEAAESRFQNVREYHGLILGEVMLCMLHIRHTHILWRGDNVAALSWARKNCCSSSAAQRAFIAHSWMAILSGNVLVDAIHQAGTTMGDIDGLSRYKTTQFSAHTDLSPALRVDELFRLCDPTLDERHLDGHLQCLHAIVSSLACHVSFC